MKDNSPISNSACTSWSISAVWWHEQTGLPLPLGGNCIRKDLGQPVCQEVTDILKKSIQFSLDHRKEAVEYALQFGRDLDRNLADQFVGMYVNDWTLDYGPRGREAISATSETRGGCGLSPSGSRNSNSSPLSK